MQRKRPRPANLIIEPERYLKHCINLIVILILVSLIINGLSISTHTWVSS